MVVEMGDLGRYNGCSISNLNRNFGGTMEKKYCIFDMDGTLVDSMGYWRSLGRDYLAVKGITGSQAEEVLKQIKPLTMLEAAQLFRECFALEGEPQTIVDEMNDVMRQHYLEDVALKPGVLDFLERKRNEGCRMCVATATNEHLARLCFQRLGIDRFFEFVLSCETMKVRKTHPDIYLEAARRLGCCPEETAVFEDAMYAARTAKNGGFYTVAVWDTVQSGDWEQICEFVDETITDWYKAE